MTYPYFNKRSVCPGCASTKIRVIYSCSYQSPPLRRILEQMYAFGDSVYEYLACMDFVLAECSACQLVFQLNIPDNFLSAKLYDEWIDPKTAYEVHLNYDLTYYCRVASDVASLVTMFKRSPSTIRVLDFGMGWGEWLNLARAFGVQAYGTEFSHTRLAFARSQGLQTLTWDEIQGQKFDLIYTDQVFEHISDPLETLRYLAGALKPGGLFKIGVPDGRDIRRRLKVEDWDAPKGTPNSLNAVAPLEHINCFNYNALVTMGAKAGLRPMHVPLLMQYSHLLLGDSLKEIFKSLVRPIWRDVLKRGIYVLFVRL